MNENSRAFSAGRRVTGKALAWLVIWLAGPLLALWLQPTFVGVVLTVAFIWICFSGFNLYFFRDPTPQVPTTPRAIVAPAHGLVDCVDEVPEPEFMRGVCRHVSIFLSVFDVHVQNAPVAGRIAFLRYQPGRFLNALKTESSRCNENVLIGIESSEQPGERIAVRQIAGLVARRIVSWVNVGDSATRGQRLGLIQYGSRCDLYLPMSAQVTIKLGDRVVGGETIVAIRGSSAEPLAQRPLRNPSFLPV
jgi:phosphatidylserine decarboxylase